MEHHLLLEKVLLPSGWKDNVLVGISPDGIITSTDARASEVPNGVQRIKGCTIPGMPNVHSHAFQRSMAGLTEYLGDSEDNFWSWRKLMYEFVSKITPEQLKIIATQLYMEMVKAGYTSVAEFHYLHHDINGKSYSEIDTMSTAIMEAASDVGIGLTLLPVLYMHSNFGGKEPIKQQKRFIHSTDSYINLIDKLYKKTDSSSCVKIGIAPHSLRAVTPEGLKRVTDYFDKLKTKGPIHIHVAEQTREVDDCLAWFGQRPVEWLVENMNINTRWCLIHATHTTSDEKRLIAVSGAVAGICPTTEANLGDGFFCLPDFLDQQGCIGIGSDSNTSVSPVEELRWLEYGQRLLHQKRNIIADSDRRSVGRGLWERCLKGGSQALFQPIGSIEPGMRADLIVLDTKHPLLAGKHGDSVLSSYIFAGNDTLVNDVMIGGKWIVQNGRHPLETSVNEAFCHTLKEILV